MRKKTHSCKAGFGREIKFFTGIPFGERWEKQIRCKDGPEHQEFCCHNIQVSSNVYRPSTFLYRYILWTFQASYTSVTLTFLLIYVIVNLVFGGLLYVAGTAEPYCITASGEYFGAHPQTKFSDAFALSWMTFTTVVRI
jgi:hypothetical protein